MSISIKENENLPLNSEIKNTAYIYFDFNAALITNTTLNVNTLLSVSEIEDKKFSIYPNPVKNKLCVESNFTSNELILFNLNGKILIKAKTGSKSELDLSDLENGMYYLQLINEKSNSVQQLVENK